MISIRTITADEIDYFVSLADPPAEEHGAIDKRILLRLWEADTLRPERCFVAEQNGELVGRVCYGDYEHPKEVEPFQIKLPWSGNHEVVGEALMRESLQAVAAAGMTHVTREFNSDLKNVHAQMAALHSVGIPVVQEMHGFLWRIPKPQPTTTDRLQFRSLDEVGEDAFLAVIEQVSRSTLDRSIQLEANQHGIDSFARWMFDIIKETTASESAWWQLAYTQQGDVVGFVVPVYFPPPNSDVETVGNIAYLGIVPEQRGNGYIDDLLACGTKTLLDYGIKEIFAQTDVENTPMIRAFERVGYECVSQVWKFHASIEDVIQS